MKNTYFHQFNYILPNMKITKILAKKIDCGSPVSNWVARNQAKLNNKPYPSEGYGYPYANDECFGTFENEELARGNLTHLDEEHEYSDETTATSQIRGFLNQYDGKGYQKILKMDFNKKDFFQDIYNTEIKPWTERKAIIAIKVEFYVYNPNLYMLNQKRFVIEFLETGGFINFEHDSILINTKLYRDWSMNIQTAAILLNGLIMLLLSVRQIKKDNDEAEALRKAQEAIDNLE